ncbi:sulfatase-like hydrolase/transferase [Aegicerativicinus sediminis]|uniref:sulfatase-like hydrolase/transferase n=1 Tax=Aegicerativicinus sediminis TaxID=2893202 RepID=UPI001E61B74F|nr:sulfatase-like hydrolase/transferase [Aegicerativicinus sediminis]
MTKNLFIILSICTLQLSCKNQDKSEELPQLNFLVIIADDAGWNDVGYNGSEINTPNIDSISEKGIRLNRFYVLPTCSPSRASLLTGIPASRFGIVAPISGRSELSLPDNVSTLPEVLKTNGYQTALFGKWHLGLKPESGPKAYGFDYSYGFLHGQIDQYTHKYKNGDQSWNRNGEFITEEGHTTDLIERETLDWLTDKRNKDKPFYIQLAYSAPHFPLQEEEYWKEPYRKTIQNSSRIDFAASMTHMDHSIGAVFGALKDLNLLENTVVIFISDNGAMENWFPKDQYNGKFGPNPVLGSNVPLRDWKSSNYEGALRVPAFIYWKNHLNPGIFKQYVSVIDIMPTILFLANNSNQINGIEGKNIWNQLTQPNEPSIRSIYLRGHLQECVIEKPWKLIRTRHKNAPANFELYNIENDPEEQNNVINNEPKVFQHLKATLELEFSKDANDVNLDIK